MTITFQFYDKATGQFKGRIRSSPYMVDGKLGIPPPGLVEVKRIQEPVPEVSTTHSLRATEAFNSAENTMTYGWEMVPIPPEDINHTPESLNQTQVRIHLYRLGLLTQVNQEFDKIPTDARTEAKIRWATAPVIRRNHPLVQQIATALNKDAAWMDQFFRDAALIT